MDYSAFANLPKTVPIIPAGIATVVVLLIAWELVWKLMAMWRAARNNELAWFVAIFLFNTLGILPILYIYVFSKKK